MAVQLKIAGCGDAAPTAFLEVIDFMPDFAPDDARLTDGGYLGCSGAMGCCQKNGFGPFSAERIAKSGQC